MLFNTMKLKLFAGLISFDLKDINLTKSQFALVCILAAASSVMVYFVLSASALWAINVIFEMSIDYTFIKIFAGGLLLWIINGLK